MKVGVDILEVQRVAKLVRESPEAISKMLYPEETRGKTESTAGKIVAKEAVMKTGLINPGEWRKIKISKTETGAPVVVTANGSVIPEVTISISHTKNLAVAVAVYDK